MDIAYALSDFYEGIYSSKRHTRSLALKWYKGVPIPNNTNTLYLALTQAEKATLISQGYGREAGSRTLTIHEAQGLTYKDVVIVRLVGGVPDLMKSLPHAVVAISRHTVSCTYYTDVFREDAVAGLITAAQKATDETIQRLQPAMWARDTAAINTMLQDSP